MLAIDKSLIGKQLDVCLKYFLDDGRTELRWIQGYVILVSDGEDIPKNQGVQACYKSRKAFMIRWGGNKETNESVSGLTHRLIRSEWNSMATHSHGSWRFNVEMRYN